MGQVVFMRKGKARPMAGSEYLVLAGDRIFVIDTTEGKQKIICTNPLRYRENYMARDIVRRFVGNEEPIEIVLRDRYGTQITEARFKVLDAQEEQPAANEMFDALIIEVERI